MTLRLLGLVLLVVGLAGCSTVRPLDTEMDRIAANDPVHELVWEVENRHRLIAGPAEQDRFERDLAAYIEEYRHWHKAEETAGAFANIRNTDLIHGDRSTRNPRNYQVNYDPGTNSYRCREGSPLCAPGGRDWFEDNTRRVALRFGTQEQRCIWVISGRQPEEQSCSYSVTAIVDEPQEVSVTRVSDGATGRTDIDVKDVLIVALGDSFSAGEGNPHIQWRANRHPALWLDARCHRSLMSGPALTAALLARSNPHISVTLLHYGCSGASVADGLVTPWSQLETAADIRAQYAAFGIRGREFEARRVATSRPGIHDVPLSQLEQAKVDLTTNGQMRQPDLILVSIGGNDIGFAAIVSALAAEGSTKVDLKADLQPGGLERVDDWRPYAPFDQVTWVQAARNVPCLGLERLDCLADRVADRISGRPSEQGRMTLDNQYVALAAAIRPLHGDRPDRVMMTHYPNFVMRERDGVPAGRATPEDAFGCDDRALDGRPGFIPGIFAWLPGVGMDEANTKRAGELFLQPLNGAVDRVAESNGWGVVSGHVRNGLTHGYCSHHRYYNTLVDSYWDQGRRYETGRPLGNIVILRANNVFNLPVGTQLYWDAARACFASFPAPSSCLPAPNSLPVLELERTIEEGATYAEMLADTSTAGTTGPVHPNLFGHCNYASAILTSLVRDRPDLPYADRLIRDVDSSGPDGLKASYVCDPQQWGYEHARPHPGWEQQEADTGL
jgi:lysophospholipase L1-like esterase